MKQKLKRVKQCAKCPWKKSTNPHDIPGGYSEEKHCNLRRTISGGRLRFGGTQHVMACHESKPEDETHCIGWLHQQLGVGNNIGLRLQMLSYDLSEVEVFGPQHQRFEDTLPQRRRRNDSARG